MPYPFQSHELWTYLSRLVPPQTVVGEDGTMFLSGKVYVLSPSPTPEGEKPFIFRFHTYYYPVEGKFSFDLEGLRGVFGGFREQEVGPKPPREGSLLHSVLSLFYSRFIKTPLTDLEYLPPLPHGDILTAIWTERSPLVPSLWYMSTELPLGYLVASSYQGSLCLARTRFSEKGLEEVRTIFDDDG